MNRITGEGPRARHLVLFISAIVFAIPLARLAALFELLQHRNRLRLIFRAVARDVAHELPLPMAIPLMPRKLIPASPRARAILAPKPARSAPSITKKLGRIERMGKRIPGSSNNPIGAGWEYLVVAVDDHARIALTVFFTPAA